MKIMIIRHGDPNYEQDCLTEKGQREALLLADRLVNVKMDYIYTSPYRRTRQTAQPTLERLGREAIVHDWLHEFDHTVTWEDGTVKHLPWDQFPARWTSYPESFDKDRWCDTPVMKSGNIKDAYDAVCQGLDALLAEHGYERDGVLYKAVKANQDTVVLFCHFGLECVLLSHLLNISPLALWHGLAARPTAITVVNTEEREKGIAYFRMDLFGDVSHLTDFGEPASNHCKFCDVYDDMMQRH